MRFVFFLFCLASGFAATTYHYEKWIEGKKTPMTWEIDKKQNKLFLKCHEDIGLTSLECSANFEDISSYSFLSVDKKYSYALDLKGKDLALVKKLKNKTQKNNFKISSPWIQQFGFGLVPFIKSAKKKIHFCLINTDKNDLVDMIATKDEIAPLKIRDKTYQAQKTTVTLTGFKSMFWKAEIWFDKENADMLKYKADNGPATPVTTLILVGKDKSSFFNLIKKEEK